MNRAEVRELLLVAEEEVAAHWQSEQPPENPAADLGTASIASTVLDRVTQLGLALLHENQLDMVREVSGSIMRLFDVAGGQVPGLGRSSDYIVEANRWYQLATRLYVLGGASVALEHYSLVPDFVVQQTRKGPRFWIRDTVTALARQARFQRKSLISPIAEFISSRPALFRVYHNTASTAVDLLCQFDFLQCVVAASITRSTSECYPNFGGFYNERTEPIVSDLVRGGKSREAIPDVSNELLAEIIGALDEETGHAFFSISGWSRNGWEDPEIRKFLDKYRPKG